MQVQVCGVFSLLEDAVGEAKTYQGSSSASVRCALPESVSAESSSAAATVNTVIALTVLLHHHVTPSSGQLNPVRNLASNCVVVTALPRPREASSLPSARGVRLQLHAPNDGAEFNTHGTTRGRQP
jgi:hypothetical protein